jgi:broad specificity phosphatase PhoE
LEKQLMRRILIAAAIAACLGRPDIATAQKAIFIVRHAERVDSSADSPLSGAGLARAELLATLLKDAGVTVIYSTAFQRTLKTAEPLARLLKIEVTLTPPTPAALIDELRTKHPRGVALVVGHSDTMPALLSALGYSEKLTIASDEYSNLFVMVPKETGPPTVLRLRF